MRRLVLVLVLLLVADSPPVVAHRLLMAGGSGSSFTTPGTNPPQTAAFTRVVGNPVLTPNGTTEAAWILEPEVIYESGTFKMIYTGHNVASAFNTSRFFYATSPDGRTWTRGNAGAAVMGGGVGGESGAVYQPDLKKVGSTYYLYYHAPSPRFLSVATSSDLITWTTLATNILGNPDGQSEWDNTSIVISGGTWTMLAEGFKSPIWKTYLWTSPDGVTWTAGNSGSPLTTLQVASGGMWGGPMLWPTQIGGLWHVWYHAATGSGTLPTSIYHATSSDFVTWTQTAGPILSYGGAAFEVDQVADPCIVVVAGTAYLFYDGDYNSGAGAGSIGLATATAVP